MEGTSQKLLVIDDYSKLNRLLTDYLGGMCFQVLTAIKPSEGAQIHGKRETGSGDPGHHAS